MTDNANLPESGVRLVAENFPAFNAAMQKANKLISEQGEKAASAAKKSASAGGVLDKFQDMIARYTQKLTQANPATAKASDLIAGLGLQISTTTAAVLAGVAAIAALGAAFIALGVRGAPLIGLAQSFDKLTASVGVASDALLEDLTTASRGMISNFDLMRQANIALAGATGEFGKQFAEKLPDLLRLAAAQARSTGQDINFLYQSLVTGIKRSSPLILDNLGLVISIEAANKTYAESIGKTVEQLTAEDKSIALLNATLEAGHGAVEGFADAQETAAEKLSRIGARVSNIFDTLALAVQPAFSAILDKVDQVVRAIEALVYQAAPYITLVAQMVGQLIGGLNLNLGPDGDLPRQLFEGAARAFGSFARGIAEAANRYIFPIVIDILTTLSSWLVGQSPPPAGPLADIDKGGENTMKAWLEGFTGVSLQPVEQVAAEVSAALGNIGSLSAKQVEARLAQLDAALKPFQDRLSIVKSQFEALSQPAEAAMNAIDRQIASTLEALSAGDEQAAKNIRTLDAQRESLTAYLNQQQAVVDAAQLQLALATAQQARERALLNIRKASLGAVDKARKKAKETVDRATAPKEKKPTGEAPLPPPVSAEPGAPVVSDSVLEAFGVGQDAVNEAAAGLTAAFTEGIGAENLADFQSNIGKINQLAGTLGSADLGARIRDQFSPVADVFDPNVPDSPAHRIQQLVDGLFNSQNPDSVLYKIQHLTWDQVVVDVNNGLESVLNLFDPTIPDSPVARLVQNVRSLTESSNPTSIPKLFENINLEASANTVRVGFAPLLDLFDPNIPNSPAQSIATFVDNLFGTTNSTSIPNLIGAIDLSASIELVRGAVQPVLDIFNPEVPNSPASLIVGFLNNLFGTENETSIPNLIGALTENIPALDIGGWIQTNIFDPVARFFTGEGEGTIGGLVKSAVDFFAGMPARIVAVLQGFGLLVFNSVVRPVEATINSFIELVEGAIKDILQSVIDIFAPQVGTVLDVGGILSRAVETLQNAQASINFGRVHIDAPDFGGAGSTTTNNTTINNVTINAPGAADHFLRKNAAFANASR